MSMSRRWAGATARIARRASTTPFDDVTATRVRRPLDAGDRRVQPDPVTEFGGDPGRHLVGAAREVVLLRATGDVEHPVQPPAVFT